MSSPLSHLQNFQINLQSSTKFFGLTLHFNTSWTPHIKILKAKCLNSLNILKYLSHTRTDCNRILLLHLIQSVAPRLAFGVMRTSSTFSRCAMAGILPLQFCFLSLTANFFASTAHFPNTLSFFPFSALKNSSFFHLNSIYADASD